MTKEQIRKIIEDWTFDYDTDCLYATESANEAYEELAKRFFEAQENSK